MHARILRLTSATNAHLFPCFARALPIRPSLQVAASRPCPRGLRGPRGQLAEARLFGQIFARLALPPSSLPVSHSCHESRNFLLWNGIRWAESSVKTEADFFPPAGAGAPGCKLPRPPAGDEAPVAPLLQPEVHIHFVIS